MKKEIILLLLLPILTLIPNEGKSCSCQEISIERAFEDYDYIFKGEIKKISKFIFSNKKVVEIAVIKIYKGELKEERIKLNTPIFSSTCGIKFKRGKEYIIYGSNRDKEVFSNRCSRTTINVSKEERLINNYLKRKN